MSKTYQDFIRKGPKFKSLVDGKVHQRAVGAVVAVVDGQNLRIGWSLCNSNNQYMGQKVINGVSVVMMLQGDRFDPNHAVELAEGRARRQAKTSLIYSRKVTPTISELMAKGVPQSSISVMGNIIKRAFEDNPQINCVTIFSSKTPKQEPVPQKVW